MWSLERPTLNRFAPSMNGQAKSPARAPDASPPGRFSTGTGTVGGPQYTDAFGRRRAPTPWQLVEKYKSLVYAMVARNADAVTRIPLRLMMDGSRVQGGPPNRACDPIKVSRSVGRRAAESGKVSSAAVDQVYEVRTHPMLRVLDRPDPYGCFSRRQLLSLMVAYQDVVGSAYLVPDGNGWDWRTGRVGRTAPEILWVLYPQYVIPIRYPASPLVKDWQYFADRVPFENALWFRQKMSLRDAYGGSYSPTYAGDVYADQEDRQVSIFDQLLGNGARPNLIVTAKDPMMPPGEVERLRFEQDMNSRQAGGNAGGLLVNLGAWDFTPVNYAQTDTAAKEFSEYDRNNLACIFGQPPTYYTTDTNLANLQAAREHHAIFGVEPRCCVLADVLTAMVQLWDQRLFFQFDPCLPEDDEIKARIVDMQVKSGLITINEANEEGRWPKKPYGDEPWMPGTMVQPSMAREKHDQGLAQGDAAMESQQKRDDFELSDAPEDQAEARALIARARWLTAQIEGRLAS
jgi:hypothetical protein